MNVIREKLQAFIERIESAEERVNAEKQDLKNIYAEAKSTGFDTKVLRAIVKLRKQDQSSREEFEALLDTYMVALGMTEDAD